MGIDAGGNFVMKSSLLTILSEVTRSAFSSRNAYLQSVIVNSSIYKKLTDARTAFYLHSSYVSQGADTRCSVCMWISE